MKELTGSQQDKRSDLFCIISEYQHYMGKFNLVDFMCNHSNVYDFTSLKKAMKKVIILNMNRKEDPKLKTIMNDVMRGI